jgi:HEPN domain-containing protein
VDAPATAEAAEAYEAAEKAVKALFQQLHGEARGHSVSGLLRGLAGRAEVTELLQQAAMRLDRLYIATRCANSLESGAPTDYFGERDAREAIADAEAILEFCKNRIS